MASPLNPAELRAWRAFLNAQASLLRRLEAELVASEDMTLAEFDVLVQLRVAPDQRLRMNELSEHVRLSPSGITRLVDRMVQILRGNERIRMVQAGLVERGPCAEDRRVTWAILTPAGRARVRRASPLHLRGVRDHFARRLSPAQLESLADALESVVPGTSGDDPVSSKT